MLIDMQPINTAFKEQGESAIDGIIGADLLHTRIMEGTLIMLKKSLC